jgi:hypothetical protein
VALIPLDLDPRPALRQRFARCVRDGRPLDLDDLVRQGIPAALARRIVAESVDIVRSCAAADALDARVEAAVVIYGPVLAEWFNVADIADQFPRPDRPGPRPGRSAETKGTFP